MATSSGTWPASAIDVPVDTMGEIIPPDGDADSEVWQKPPRSPTALISLHDPAAGTSRSSTAVSSMPVAAADDQVVGCPLSAAVRSLVPNTVAPVPYIARLPLNGSMAIEPIHQPNLGVPPQAR